MIHMMMNKMNIIYKMKKKQNYEEKNEKYFENLPEEKKEKHKKIEEDKEYV